MAENKPAEIPRTTLPRYAREAAELALQLATLTTEELERMLRTNRQIAATNRRRYRQFHGEEALPALLAYTGVVFRHIAPERFTPGDFEYAQQHLNITSFLYGRCYENVFLLTKSKSYYYDAAAIAEPIAPTTAARYRGGRSAGHKYDGEVPGQGKVQGINRARTGGYYDEALMPTTRNKRDVWHINTVPYKGGHFAAFPPKLAETCILAGCPKGGVVLDPFFGSGTTGLAAKSLDRHYIGIELNYDYCTLARARIGGETN